MRSSKGTVLTVTILMAVIISLMAGYLTLAVRQDSKMSYKDEKGIKAFYLAEAGIADAFATLKEDWTHKDEPAEFPLTTLVDGTYDVTILQPSGRVVVQSIGTYKDVTREIIMEVKYEGGEAFEYGVFANADIVMRGSSDLNGNVRTNANVDLSGSASIAGDAASTGTITTGGSATISGSQIEGSATVDFPEFDFNTYYNLAQSDGLYYNGDQNFSGVTLTPNNGVIYVNGIVTVSGTSSVTGGIIATGGISISGTFTQTQVGSIPALMSRDGDVQISGTANMTGLIYTATGEVNVSGNGSLSGQIISFGGIRTTGTADLTVTIDEQPPPGLSGETGPIKTVTYHNK